MNKKTDDDNDVSLYYTVAQRVKELIISGAYKSGKKVPSLRELAENFHVSVNTVREAYAYLEDHHYISCVPQSGYYVLPQPEFSIVGGPDPATMDPEQVSLCKIYGSMQEKNSTEEDALGLAIATFSKDMWPLDKIQKYTVQAIRLHHKASLDYQLSPGYMPLREQIAIHSLLSGSRVSPERILVTSGCQESMYIALAALLSPGDTVAVESPMYFNLLRMMEFMKLNILEIPCSPETGMHLETLRFALDQYNIKAVLSIANFHNPTGSLMSDGKKEELVKMLSLKRIPLIEDDVYGDLCFGSERPRSCQSFDTDGTVIYCSSFSKTISPGLRLGWIYPGRWYSQIDNLKMIINMGAASIPQVATSLFLEDGGFARHLRKVRLQLSEKSSALQTAVRTYFPPHTRVSKPSGGMVVWVELSCYLSAAALYKRAFQEGIVIAPGNLFSLQDRFSSCFRLNAGVWKPSTEELIKKLGSIAFDLMPQEQSMQSNHKTRKAL